MPHANIWVRLIFFSFGSLKRSHGGNRSFFRLFKTKHRSNKKSLSISLKTLKHKAVSGPRFLKVRKQHAPKIIIMKQQKRSSFRASPRPSARFSASLRASRPGHRDADGQRRGGAGRAALGGQGAAGGPEDPAGAPGRCWGHPAPKAGSGRRGGSKGRFFSFSFFLFFLFVVSKIRVALVLVEGYPKPPNHQTNPN